MKKLQRRTLSWPIVFCIALIIRVSYNLTVGRGYVAEFDAHFYRDLGLDLVNEHCFCFAGHIPTVGRAPFWPFIIALIDLFLGANTLFPRLFLCVIGSVTCMLVYLLASALFGRQIAVVTGLLAAVYPGLFIYDGWLYSESLYTFLQMAFCYTLYRFQCTQKNSWAFWSGICIALAALTRPNGLSFIGLICLWAVIVCTTRQLPWKTVIRSTLATIGTAILLLIPWTIRNFLQTQTFIPVATGDGAVLAGTYNTTSLVKEHGMWVSSAQIQPPLAKVTDAYETTYALHWIRSHLWDMPYLFSLHFLNMWIPYTSEAGLPMIQFPTRFSSQIVWHMIWITTPLIFALVAVGLVVTWRRWKQDLLIVYLLIALTIATNVVFYGSSRFRAPIEPLLVLLAGGCLWWLCNDEPGTLRYRLRYGTWS